MVSGKNPVNCAILLTFLWRYDTAKNQKKKANFQINHQSLGTALHRYFVFRTAVPKYPYEQRGYLCLVPTLSFPLPVLVVLWLDVYQPARNIPGLYFANYAVKENNLPNFTSIRHDTEIHNNSATKGNVKTEKIVDTNTYSEARFSSFP